MKMRNKKREKHESNLNTFQKSVKNATQNNAKNMSANDQEYHKNRSAQTLKNLVVP